MELIIIIMIEIKCIMNVMHSNHPQTMPLPSSVEKVSSAKLIPGARKARDHCLGSSGIRAAFCHSSHAAPSNNRTFLNREQQGLIKAERNESDRDQAPRVPQSERDVGHLHSM